MKNKGFTLIELLAVIVILAIIALIAVPIVLNIINDSKEQSRKRSAELYEKAVLNAVMQKQLDGKTQVPDGPYTVQANGSLICSDATICGETEIPVEVEGERPAAGSTIAIENGKVTAYSLTISGKTITKPNGSNSGTGGAEKICTANTTLPTALVWRGDDDPGESTSYSEQQVGVLATPGHEYDKGVAYTCNLGDSDDAKGLTFYVLGSNGDNVSLIAGFNLGGTVSWCASGSNNSCNGDGLEPQLTAAKTAWTEITDKTKIAVPTKEQIEGAYSGTMPTWLKSYSKLPVAYGYWTSSPYADNTLNAWIVDYRGLVDNSNVDNSFSFGVRPVITLNKNQLN